MDFLYIIKCAIGIIIFAFSILCAKYIILQIKDKIDGIDNITKDDNDII